MVGYVWLNGWSIYDGTFLAWMGGAFTTWMGGVVMVECSKNAGIYLFMLHYIYEYTCAEYASRRRISRNMQVDICCNHVWRVGARCWGWGIALKMAKRSSEEFQKVSKVLCESPLDSPCIHLFFLNLSDSFSFALLSQCPFVSIFAL